MRELICEIVVGSQMFGTTTPDSDTDTKAVHLPTAREIILQKIPSSITHNTKEKHSTRKNTSSDSDYESYSLDKFLKLVGQGQTITLEMLFAPISCIVKDSPIWNEVIANRDHLISRKSAAFVGYCYTQASKYGIKGSRVAAIRAAKDLMAALYASHPQSKVGSHAAAIQALVDATPNTSIIELETPNGLLLKHFEVCGKKMPFTNSIKSAVELLNRIFDEYGQRALLAEKNEGIDWKAMSHAVRVANEAIELITTGKITLPLPNADYVRAIKQGKISYNIIANEIENLLEKIKVAEQHSILPPTIDNLWIDNFIFKKYISIVLDHPS